MNTYLYNQVKRVLDQKNKSDGTIYKAQIQIAESRDNKTKWVSIPDNILLAVARLIDELDS